MNAKKLPVVIMTTDLGNIAIEIDSERAPVTAANFLRYVDGGFYDGGDFQRTVRPDTETRKDAPIQVIQARANPAREAEAFPPIPLEHTGMTGLKHVDGTLSMARDVTPAAAGTNTATSTFFICVGDQPSLDFGGKRSPDGQGFAVFAKIISGMDVATKIHLSSAPKDTPATKYAAQGQTLIPAIKILRAYRKDGAPGPNTD